MDGYHGVVATVMWIVQPYVEEWSEQKSRGHVHGCGSHPYTWQDIFCITGNDGFSE